MTGTLHSPRLGLNEVYIVSTRDGSETLYSHKFASTYHSHFGAVSESRHVFIHGLNAFLAYLFSVKHHIHLQYTGIEAFPIDLSVAGKLDYPGYLVAKDSAHIFLRMHEEDSFILDGFTFNRKPGWEWFTAGVEFDCIFFDAFHPVAQPELWSQDIFDAMYKVTTMGGCLITYCAQGEVRRRMQSAGFIVERIAGATGKREMLRAIKRAMD